MYSNTPSTPPSAPSPNSSIQESQSNVNFEADRSLLGDALFKATRGPSAPYYTDVTLVTPDNERVFAIRKVLALHSGYFNEFLRECGDGAQVQVNVKRKQLEMVMEFIYLDDCALFRLLLDNDTQQRTCDEVKNLIKLQSAAYYLQMARLMQRCTFVFRNIIKNYPQFVCAILKELCSSEVTPHWLEDMKKQAFRVAAVFPKEAFLIDHRDCCQKRCGVMHLTSDTVKPTFLELLKRDWVDHTLLFQALLVWGSNGEALRDHAFRPSPSSCEVAVDVGAINFGEQEFAIAKDIAQHIDPSKFEPAFLCNVVDPSGFLPADRMSVAYKGLILRLDATVRNMNECKK